MNKLSYAAGLLSIIGGFLLAIFVDQPSDQEKKLAVVAVQETEGTKVHEGKTAPVKELADAVDRPLERARREMKLLDDMYKTSIVLITQHYVNTSDDLPAGEAFKLLFQGMEDKGWHKVRLMDATGEPLNDENEPRKGFEKKAVKELLTGKAVFDEVVKEDGKRFLQAATAIPVVLTKCIMCHDNYKGLPKGQAIGAISYKIPIHDDESKTNSK